MSTPTDALRALVNETLVASLAVIEDSAPAVSLVGFAPAWGPARIHLLVSELSSHTPALRVDRRCALMMNALPSPDDERSNHALTRLMLRGAASFLSRGEALARGITAAYRARYAIADTLLGLSDFSFVEIVPEAGTFIMGFGRAYRVSGSDLDQLDHIGR